MTTRLSLLLACGLVLAACGSSNKVTDGPSDRIVLPDVTGGSGGTGGTGGSDGGGTCTLVPQGGCQAGQKCSVDPMTSMIGCLTAGSTMAGQSCTMETQCAAGTACANTGNGAVCMTYCRNDQAHAFTDCATMGNGSACFWQLQDMSGSPIMGANVCSIPCNSINPGTTCGAMQECAYDDLTWTNPYGTCLPPGTLAAGMNCTQIGQCAPPTQCLRVGANMFSCRHLCDSTHMCPTGACTAFSATSVMGLGFCSN